MRIQVAEVSDVITESGKNNKQYQSCVVSYYSNGKKYEKKLTQYSDAFKLLKAAIPDQLFTVDLEKNGAFTEWKNVAPIDAEVQEPVVKAEPESKGKATKNVQKSTSITDPRETPEERKARQELIVRQSSLTNAIEYAKMRSSGPVQNAVAAFTTVENILQIAKQFRDFVYEVETSDSTS